MTTQETAILPSEGPEHHALLLSSSYVYGKGYLDFAEQEIIHFLGPIRSVLFVPYALRDHATYTSKVRERFGRFGCDLASLHEAPDPTGAVLRAQAIFVGGGNTFRLLKALYDHSLIAPIRQRVKEGMLYIGSSAGSNVAGPTIKTTKDMPIVQPVSFNALGLVSFQISPHFQDPDPNSRHMGETQEERILQFHEECDTPVLGLREGAMVWVEEGTVTLRGVSGARIFLRGQPPIEAVPGDVLNRKSA
jgi:dipeptidase E